MYWGIVVIASTVVIGELSIQIALAVWRAEPSVVAIRVVAFVAVPTAISPALPALQEALEELDGESEAEGEILVLADGLNDALGLDDADGEREALTLELGERLADGLKLADGELDPEIEALGEAELDGLPEAEALGEREALGDKLTLSLEDNDELGLNEALGLDEIDELGLILSEGDSEADAEPEGEVEAEIEVELEGETEEETCPRAVTTFPKILSITAPVTVNKVAVPTAPVPALAVKVIVFRAWIDQSGLTTLAPFLPIC